MNLQLIRNATLKLQYAGTTYLIDPYFAKKYAQPSFAGKSKNPTVDLPCTVTEIVEGVDYILISHLHPDHFDESAQKILDKDIPVLCQPEDEKTIRILGFKKVIPIEKHYRIGTTTISRTNGQHGSGKILKFMGTVSGFVFQDPKEKTAYWMGDTVLNAEVIQNLKHFIPEIIVCHAGGNRFLKEYDIFAASLEADTESVIMDKQQVIELCRLIPDSIVIATHLESLDHETVTRKELKAFASDYGISFEQLIIPEDGMSLDF